MSKKEKLKAATDTELAAKEGDKLTIYDYEKKYIRRQNARGAKFALAIIATLIGVFLFFCLFSVTMRIYDMNEYAGYAAAVVCLIVYILVFVVPLIKVLRTDYFVTNVNRHLARDAQRHNRRVRHDIADKMVDLTARVEGVGWYDTEIVGQLAVALHANDEEGIKTHLNALYAGSVKRSAKDLIFRASLKSAAYSAVSQTANVDAVLVVLVNLQLVKDLVFLYGFRPSNVKLMKIFGAVLRNSLIAYGLGGLNIGNSVVKTMGDAIKGIPILGTAISAIVDSSVQGLTNGTLTTVMGYQTIRYLNEEYKLQNILDGIELPQSEEEMEEACNELEEQLKKEKKLKTA